MLIINMNFFQILQKFILEQVKESNLNQGHLIGIRLLTER